MYLELENKMTVFQDISTSFSTTRHKTIDILIMFELNTFEIMSHAIVKMGEDDGGILCRSFLYIEKWSNNLTNNNPM